ncbi:MULTISPECIES: response regulator [Maricaulis]|jgi:CheY-like chemotaxis protein|uniref:response regulator n=1 Tax=Maricaulis TaxID=74317 RepID=UPI0025C708B6|nr:response regulator [Maricaulis sp.]
MVKMLKRILLLEDIEANADLIKFSLQAISGFDVAHASNARQAVEMFRTGTYDLCLFDHLMPKMTGLDAMREIRATPKGEQVPIVFLTARSDTANWKQLMASGAQAVIAKPFDIMLLGAQLLDVFHACQICEINGGIDADSGPSWADTPTRSALSRRSAGAYGKF